MDSKTASTLLEAASQFLHEVLKSKGRRSDDDRNAFWSSIVSLMPRDLADKRMIASAMRLLKVPRSVIKRATTIRGELEDRARGWRRITSIGHRDKVEGFIISAAWHSELLSSEDNQNKQSYAIYCGVCEMGDEQYAIHWRGAQYGSDKDALRRCKGSEFEAKLRAATKTPTRPDGVGCCLKLLRKYKCQCIKKRKASECDCKICTLADVRLRRYHKARHGWRTLWRKAAGGSLYRPPPCTCFICGHPGRLADFLQVSKSMHSMMQVLLPCGKMEFKPYSLEGGDRFGVAAMVSVPRRKQQQRHGCLAKRPLRSAAGHMSWATSSARLRQPTSRSHGRRGSHACVEPMPTESRHTRMSSCRSTAHALSSWVSCGRHWRLISHTSGTTCSCSAA